MAWVGFYWLGLDGLGLACVANTALLRSVCSTRVRTLVVDTAALVDAWITPLAVCIHTRVDHVAQEGLWLCRDEVAPAQWAQLLRCLQLHVPRQAVGLSISS